MSDPQCMHKNFFSKGLKEISNIIKKTKLFPIQLMSVEAFPQFIQI